MPIPTLKRISAVLVLLLATTAAFAAGGQFRKAGAKDKCAVCGMFVAKYPEFAAQLQFKDGSIAHFDGSKDLFKFYLAPSRYLPGKKSTDIQAVFVTSYYKLAPIDGMKAFYVIGSDVNGPMGQELIAFSRESEARDFLKDHKGKSILRFPAVTTAILKSME